MTLKLSEMSYPKRNIMYDYQEFWIGIDDTDSLHGMCTTYLAVKIIEELKKLGFNIIGYPRLIRLNPNVPFKTRGNGAVSFLVKGEIDEIINVIDKNIEKHAELDDDNTHPGVVIVRNYQKDLEKIYPFSNKVIKDVVQISDATKIIRQLSFSIVLAYKTGRGVIGALAAIGTKLYDYTYELLTYRFPENFDKERVIDEDSFYEADLETYPKTWDTVDWQNKVVVAVPNSPNPVLYGIRGDSISAILKAKEIIKTEKYEHEMIFVTNQGTDMHLIKEDEIQKLEDYRSYIIRGKVVKDPEYKMGGHVFFSIMTKFGEITCAAFEPTKQFRNIVSKLKTGDIVEVYGGYKKGCINLEKINVIEVADVYIERNPICPKCGKRMKSAGKNQGFRCKRCKTYEFKKEKIKVKREIETGFYEVPPCARRHISKPLIRMNVEKRHIFR